jgi:hypothetical protein
VCELAVIIRSYNLAKKTEIAKDGRRKIKNELMNRGTNKHQEEKKQKRYKIEMDKRTKQGREGMRRGKL